MATKEKTEKSRGYKANLKVAFKDLNMSVPVRYEKISSKDIQSQIEIIAKATDGETVENKFRYTDINDCLKDVTNQVEAIASRTKCLFGINNGKIYTHDEVRDYQIIRNDDGSVKEELEVSAPTETTKDFDVSDTRQLDTYDSYLAESEYEVFSEEDPGSLKILADYLLSHNICILFDFQRCNTHKPMKGVIKPVFEDDGKWTLVMRLTMTKYSYKHLQEPTAVQKQVKTQTRARVALAI